MLTVTPSLVVTPAALLLVTAMPVVFPVESDLVWVTCKEGEGGVMKGKHKTTSAGVEKPVGEKRV